MNGDCSCSGIDWDLTPNNITLPWQIVTPFALSVCIIKCLNLDDALCIEFMNRFMVTGKVYRPEWSGQAVDAEESRCTQRDYELKHRAHSGFPAFSALKKNQNTNLWQAPGSWVAQGFAACLTSVFAEGNRVQITGMHLQNGWCGGLRCLFERLR